MRFDATLVDSGFQSQREQPLHGDFDKRLARVSTASLTRDNEIKLAAPTGAAKEEEWIEQL